MTMNNNNSKIRKKAGVIFVNVFFDYLHCDMHHNYFYFIILLFYKYVMFSSSSACFPVLQTVQTVTNM